MNDSQLPPDIAEHNALMRRTGKIALICLGAFIFFALVAVATAAPMKPVVYMPSIVQRCNPCAHSVPMPTLTPTPDIGEPPALPSSKVAQP